VIGCAEELGFKETDRRATTAQMLRSLGVRIEATSSSLSIEGGAAVRSGVTDSFGDHRIAMAAATLAASLEGSTLVRGGTCHATSYPEFTATMRSLGVGIVVSQNISTESRNRRVA
jgi:3-phosphoshikimate 1-carboxyvinyltransferase